MIKSHAPICVSPFSLSGFVNERRTQIHVSCSCATRCVSNCDQYAKGVNYKYIYVRRQQLINLFLAPAPSVFGQLGVHSRGRIRKDQGCKMARCACYLVGGSIVQIDAALLQWHICAATAFCNSRTRTHPPNFGPASGVRVDGPTGWSARSPSPASHPLRPIYWTFLFLSFWSECVVSPKPQKSDESPSKLHRFRGVAKSPAGQKIQPKKLGIFHS